MHKRVVAVAILLGVLSGTGWAQVREEAYVRERAPGAALAAAFANVLFMPARLMATVFGGFLGGFTGFMTAGDHEAAEDVWAMFDGDQLLTPEMMRGRERLHFGEVGPH